MHMLYICTYYIVNYLTYHWNETSLAVHSIWLYIDKLSLYRMCPTYSVHPIYSHNLREVCVGFDCLRAFAVVSAIIKKRIRIFIHGDEPH
jgi:hypothetical protein